MMYGYTLTARQGLRTLVVIFDAESDIDAAIQASHTVMEYATWSNVWANGSIELVSPNGTVLEKMGAK
jgi:hypothetical protein